MRRSNLVARPMTLPIVRTAEDLRAHLAPWRRQGARTALVATMGALHAGHLSLLRLAKAQADKAIATVFVNPKQFAPHEDFALYPRDEAGDAAKLEAVGCDLLYAPSLAAIYPPDFATAVTVAGVSAPLEGEKRPHFFGGVATVVAKLLIQAGPDKAVFGEKDYQQLLVIRRMAADLDLGVEILAGETVREPDGLALSSRNVYLDPAARAVAGRLNVVLAEAAAQVRAGAAPDGVQHAGEIALAAAGFTSVDYLAVRDAGDLSPLTPGRPARVLAAAWIGPIRLIDNIAV